VEIKRLLDGRATPKAFNSDVKAKQFRCMHLDSWARVSKNHKMIIKSSQMLHNFVVSLS